MTEREPVVVMARLIPGVVFALPTHSLCRTAQRVELIAGQVRVDDGKELLGGFASLGMVGVVGAHRGPDVANVTVDDLLVHGRFGLRGVTRRTARQKGDYR